MEQGLYFFAFLFLIAAAIMALVPLLQGKSPEAPSRTRGDGIVVDTQGPEIPKVIQVKVKRNWKGNDLFEDNFSYMGEVADTIGRSAARFIFGKKKKKKKKDGDK
jgi:hypothetical protein